VELLGPDVMVTTGVLFWTVQLIESEPEPETFVATTTRLCPPGAKPVVDQGEMHAVAGAPSRLQVTVAEGSDTVKSTVASVAAVEAGGPLSIVTVGVPTGGADTVQVTEADPEPPAFDALITTVCGPTASPVADQGDVHAAAGAPSRLHVTVAAGSETLNDTRANGAVVEDAGPPVTVTTGAGGSTVQL
jgi:hypothetical protein